MSLRKCISSAPTSHSRLSPSPFFAVTNTLLHAPFSGNSNPFSLYLLFGKIVLNWQGIYQCHCTFGPLNSKHKEGKRYRVPHALLCPSSVHLSGHVHNHPKGPEDRRSQKQHKRVWPEMLPRNHKSWWRNKMYNVQSDLQYLWLAWMLCSTQNKYWNEHCTDGDAKTYRVLFTVLKSLATVELGHWGITAEDG